VANTKTPFKSKDIYYTNQKTNFSISLDYLLNLRLWKQANKQVDRPWRYRNTVPAVSCRHAP